MTSLSLYIILSVFFHANKVATLTQIEEIYSQSYFHVCTSVSQPVRNIGIAVFARL